MARLKSKLHNDGIFYTSNEKASLEVIKYDLTFLKDAFELVKAKIGADTKEPLTRSFNEQVKGLGSDGKGDRTNYYDYLKSVQEAVEIAVNSKLNTHYNPDMKFNDIEILPWIKALPVWLQGPPDGFGGWEFLRNTASVYKYQYKTKEIIIEIEDYNEVTMFLEEADKYKYIYLKISVEVIHKQGKGDHYNVKYLYIRFEGNSAKRLVFKFDTHYQKAWSSSSSQYVGHRFPLFDGWYKVSTVLSGAPQLLKA